ncbi:myozenin-2-like [Periophthalmus magnuspinnatus]|uniref:myozenin-2-like n=1 Tax=Periophthalmus magnuspinnatus TaxID=409849 RepID=UPI00145C1449|nr:myozenin-2-like [Periophthalmus magnuspinnatus]
MMMMMQPGLDNATRLKIMQAQALCKEARGDHLNLGKKISIPKDVMMEELNVPNRNRGSRMFQERQKRVEKFTLENNSNAPQYIINVPAEAIPPEHFTPEPQVGKENQTFSMPGKHSLVMNLQKTVAKKGSPGVLAPGYSGPLKEIPHERFNTTVIPKSYCSPWRQALASNEELLNTLNSQLPENPQGQQPANYRSFNRAAVPFGGMMASRRVVPVIGFEAVESQTLPGAALDHMCQRPNFNRAPRGWGINYSPESNEL